MTKLRYLLPTIGADAGKEDLTTRFLTNFTASFPAFNDVSPMKCGDSYTANKICEFLFGSSLKLADKKWKLRLWASLLCEYGESGETPINFLFNSKLQSANRPNNCTNLNVFNLSV